MHLSHRFTRLVRSSASATTSHTTQRTILPTSTHLLQSTQHRLVSTDSQVYGSGSLIQNKVTWIMHKLFQSESGRVPEPITLKSGKKVNRVSDANLLNDTEQHELLQQLNQKYQPTDAELRNMIQYDAVKYNISLPIQLSTSNKRISSVNDLQKLKPEEKVELRQVMWESILEEEQDRSSSNNEMDEETQAAVEQSATETRPITMMIILMASLGLLTIMNVSKGVAAPKDELADRIQLRAVRKTKKPEPLPPPPEGVPDYDERAQIGVKTISPLRIA